VDLKFPPAGDESAAESHVIDSLQAPLGDMVLASVSNIGGSGPGLLQYKDAAVATAAAVAAPQR